MAEVYVDDLVIRSDQKVNYLVDLREAFKILGRLNMKLNWAKYTFDMRSGKFLGYLVTRHGIEANSDQIRALQELSSPTNIREIQSLVSKTNALSQFISKLTDIYSPIFEQLKKGVKFEWSPAKNEAFRKIKEILGWPLVLSKPRLEEELDLYIFISGVALSTILIRDDGNELSIYFISRRLKDEETRYSAIEKVGVALRYMVERLRPYFAVYLARVISEYPMKAAMDPKNGDRLGK